MKIESGYARVTVLVGDAGGWLFVCPCTLLPVLGQNFFYISYAIKIKLRTVNLHARHAICSH